MHFSRQIPNTGRLVMHSITGHKLSPHYQPFLQLIVMTRNLPSHNRTRGIKRAKCSQMIKQNQLYQCHIL